MLEEAIEARTGLKLNGLLGSLAQAAVSTRRMSWPELTEATVDLGYTLKDLFKGQVGWARLWRTYSRLGASAFGQDYRAAELVLSELADMLDERLCALMAKGGR